jgi:SAM-dependent methyltransferase
LLLVGGILGPLQASEDDEGRLVVAACDTSDAEDSETDTLSYEYTDHEDVFDLEEAQQAYSRISFRNPDELYTRKLEIGRFLKGEDQPDDYLCHCFVPDSVKEKKEVLQTIDAILTNKSCQKPIVVHYPLLKTVGKTYDPGYSFGGISWLKQECLRETRHRANAKGTPHLLDAGCGHFYFTFPALLAGAKVMAVDQHPDLTDVQHFKPPFADIKKVQPIFPEKDLKQRLTIVNADLLTYLKGIKEVFDITYAGDVIHYQSCLKAQSFIQCLYTATKPGGMVYACANAPDPAAFEIYTQAKGMGKKFPGYYVRNTMTDQKGKSKSTYLSLDGAVDDVCPAYLMAGFYKPNDKASCKEKAKKLLVQGHQFTHRAILEFDADSLRALFEEAGFVVIDLSYAATTGRLPENTVLSTTLLQLISRVQIIALKPSAT